MKKILVSALIVSALTVSLATIADTVELDKGYISVSKSTTKEISPNQAEITFAVETSDKSMKKASDDNKELSKKVYSTLKQLIAANDYLKTSNYSARPVYITTKDNKRILDKYTVSNAVTVKVKNTELVPKLIDSAITQGATSVENLQFAVSDYDSACNDAYVDLTKKAYTQAKTIAGAINAKVSGIKSINTSCSAENYSRPYFGMAMKNAMDSVSATPIEVGKQRLNINIDASFYVE